MVSWFCYDRFFKFHIQLFPIFYTYYSLFTGSYFCITRQPDSALHNMYPNPSQCTQIVGFLLFFMLFFRENLLYCTWLTHFLFRVIYSCPKFENSLIGSMLWVYAFICKCQINKIIKIIIICIYKHCQEMKANFQINLPSIPGKNIKFKIQDIKTAAFLTQKSRFPDDKTGLTKKFVQSFQNFREKRKEQDAQTQAETQLTKSQISQKKQLQFRPFISDNKKFLLPIYSELKKEQTNKLQKSLDYSPASNAKGFSFGRAGLNQIQNVQESILEQTGKQQENNQNYLTDNYYFSKQKLYEDGMKPKRQKPSAVFKAETRKKVYDRIYSSVVPGPGAYIKDKPIVKSKQRKSKSKNTENSLLDDKHLKDIIGKVLIEQKNQSQEQIEQKKQLKNDHMFVIDDRDRFGQQIFPIAPKLKVPGPGSYQNYDNIEERAKKLLLVEEQRKLLKQWFNN